MKPREAVPINAESATRQWSIPSRLTLTVVPLAVVTLLLGLFLVWNLISSDTTDGFSGAEWIAIAIAIAVLATASGTLMAAHRAGRSMTRRIDEVSTAVKRVADKDLVELLDALRSPDFDLGAIAPMTLEVSRGDELGDLARSIEGLHGSLIEVGARQMEALRSGVSSIFVTLARRNSSLVDRQLALLDQLESREDDPKVLGGFYQLDHLAARMRRNAESLLVLAGSESPRVWAKATDMSDVVRAAVSEIDEYQRIEVLALEPARLSGGAVSDVSHLVAELLDNAIQFSPPSEMIRVTGLFDMDGYQLAISDRGVGMSEARIEEMNRILERPPALGLSVEPTLGMYVVAKLAHRHGLKVEMIRGVPGITARITIPRDHLEVTKEPETRPWDTDRSVKHAEASPESIPEVEFADAETRAYVFKKSRDEVVDTPVGDSSSRTPDEIVDLTAPPYLDPSESGPTELPVRTPGGSFVDSDEETPSVSAGEGASRIKTALAAYDRGRRSAEASGDAKPTDGDHEDNEGQK
ncbi:MAG TPA: ATP-binding protein [Acidimicrobiia bacterium]